MRLSLVPVAHDDIDDSAAPPPSVEEVYAAHHDLVYRIGLRYGSGSAQWAEDLTHDVFLRLFNDPRLLEGVHNVGGWLHRTATNTSLNRLSRERFLQSAPLRWLLIDKMARPPDPESLGITDQRLRLVLAEVERMPPRQRACFYMYFVDDKTQTEIGETLGLSKSYICKLLARVKARLERLEGRGP